MAYKPEGYTSVAPYLIVKDAQATLDFLRDVFRAEPLRVMMRAGGGIEHAEARIDDTVVMMGEMPDGPQAHVHVYVEDAKTAFDRAVEAGGQIVQPLETKDDGDRRGGIRDVNGTTWWIASGSE